MTDLNLKKIKVSLRTAFDQPYLPPEALITGFEGQHPSIPPVKPYVFQREKLRDVLAFWTSGNIALKIQGDPATGKTSLVSQWHARLGWPLDSVNCSGDTEASALIGGMLPMSDGTLKWFDGPCTKAYRLGTSVLLDEYNLLQPSQSSGLNMMLEGYPITIPQTGEIITPKKGFRVFATENDVQSRLNVTGRNLQDVANDDRWMNMVVDYLPQELEIRAVHEALLAAGSKAARAEMLAEQVVKLANSIRKAYREEERGIEKPMSTRTAIRWALLIDRFQGVPQAEGGPMVYALQRAFAMSKDMAPIVIEKAKAQLGLNV